MMWEPKGPVYVNFDAEIQEQRVAQELEIPDVDSYVRTTRLQADPAALAQAADWLAEASFPVILTGTLGREPSSVQALVQLAELLGAPVLSTGERMNFPTCHPLNLSGDNAEILGRADLVLALDPLDLQGALSVTDRATRRYVSRLDERTRVVQISLADLAVRSLTHDFMGLYPTALSILADTALAVPCLTEQLESRLDSARREQVSKRRAELEARHATLRAGWRAQAEREADGRPVSLAHLSRVVGEAIAPYEPVLAYNGFNPWPDRLWDLRTADQSPGGSGGAGLGYGIAGAAGVALAHKDSNRLCLSLQPDGDLLYATSTLWTIAKYQLPLLMVMHNNRSYYNSEEHAQRMAETRGRPMERSGIGVRIDEPEVDFATVARGFDIWAEGVIEDPAEVEGSVRRAVDVVVNQRKPALVDVVTLPR
jgi:thiamine pyrophosphate-dependent acetolactate synthase large subunit-like protein